MLGARIRGRRKRPRPSTSSTPAPTVGGNYSFRFGTGVCASFLLPGYLAARFIRVIADVLSDFLQFSFAADNVNVIIALPEMFSTDISQRSEMGKGSTSCRRFIGTDDSAQRWTVVCIGTEPHNKMHTVRFRRAVWRLRYWFR